MVPPNRQRAIELVLLTSLVALGILIFADFFRQVFRAWRSDGEYSFGILMPPLVVYLIWARRRKFSFITVASWFPGLLLAMAGCGLQVVASRSGTLLLSGIAAIVTAAGAIGYLWGRERLMLVAGPLALLVLMIPLPSYILGQLSWSLQSAASTASGAILGLIGVPVYQDGNLLRLSNFVLEVKQACSGSRSIFAMLALACALGLTMETKFWARVLLVIVTPFLAIGANIVRIVGTGLIARGMGSLAANESLHQGWGIAVFLIGVLGLLATRNLLGWVACKNAQLS